MNTQPIHIELYAVEPRPYSRRESLLAALQSTRNGVPVTLTRMRKLLTASEFRQFYDEFRASHPRPTERERPVLTQYSRELRQGDIHHGRAQKLPTMGPGAWQREQQRRAARRLYGAALERLYELLGKNPDLAYLFDRVVADGEHTDDPEGMPRLVGAVSEHVLPAPMQPYNGVADVQGSALRWSLAALELAAR